MSDPFSVSAGVVGVVSLGLTVCQGLIAYYGPWKGYDDEIAKFTTRLEGLQSTLKVLGGFVSPEQELDLPSDQYRDLVSLQLDSCQKSCGELDELLQKCRSNDTSPFVRKHDWLRLKRALYPFNKDSLVTVSHTVSGLQDNLQLSLQLLNSALISQQQKQIQKLMSTTTTINIQTTKVLGLVQTSASVENSSQAISLQETARSKSRISPLLQPTTLNMLCNKQAMLNSTRRNAQRSPTSSSQFIPIYCTCRNQSWRSETFSFSVFTTHQRSCPLHMRQQQTTVASINYAFCNRVLGLSVMFTMTLRRGAGAMSISPTLKVHPVVSDHSPAFQLLNKTHLNLKGRATPEVVDLARDSLINLFRNGEASPTDRLADGTTLLHAAAMMGADTSKSPIFYNNLRTLESIQKLLYALFEAGVPMGEHTIHGDTAFDILAWRIPKYRDEDDSIFALEIQMLQTLLKSGESHERLNKHASWRRARRQSPMTTYLSMQAIRALKEMGEFDDLEPSAIEHAIMMRSESDLKYCIAQSKHVNEKDGQRVMDFENLLACCLGWVPGINLLMESSLPGKLDSAASCFKVACRVHEHESALLLLRYTTTVPESFLAEAERYRNVEVMAHIISALVKQRQTLRDLATRFLPSDTLHALALPKTGLLDVRALPVYYTLSQCGIQVDLDRPPSKRSVYSEIFEVEDANMLYDAGFTDLHQRGEDGNTPLSDLTASDSRWGQEALGGGFSTMANWMIGKGASLDQPSIGGSPTIFDLAVKFGRDIDNVNTFWRSPTGEQTSYLERAWPVAFSLLATILGNNTGDGCFCACSQGGCSPLSRLLRSYCDNHRSHSPGDVPPFDKIAELLEELEITQDTEQLKKLFLRTLRYATFEALEMSHTCHGTDYYRTRCSPEETAEIRDEDFTSILQLDSLMVEFSEKYNELAVNMSEFIKGYWQPRMDEFNAEEEIDPEDATRIREIGVIITTDR